MHYLTPSRTINFKTHVLLPILNFNGKLDLVALSNNRDHVRSFQCQLIRAKRK